MKENLKEISFNLNKEMIEYLIKFNNLKKELIKINNKVTLEDKDVALKQNIEADMKKIKIYFIKAFRRSNVEEIKKYLEAKDL